MAVSITGMGAVSALGLGVDALQSGLMRADSGIRVAASADSPASAFPVAAVSLETPPTEDRARHLALRAANEALEEARWTPAIIADPKTMLVVATTKGGLNVAERVMEGRVGAEHVQQAFLFALAPRLADALGLGGAVQTVSLACASGVVAVGMARQAILRGEVDRALVVGVDALCNFIYRGFATLQALDVDGARPFDAHRAGLTVGEGGMAVTLERANGDLCVLGYGGSNDANHITGPARDGRGLVAALERAFDGTNLKPEQVGVGVLHGTGTRYNDAMEGVGYGRVFGPNAMPTLSVKGAIGHTMGAAGLANIIVAARSLRDGRVPPNVGLREQDPEIALDIVNGPPRSVARPYAVTSASGFAGVNAAVLLGPARQEPPRGRRKKQTPTPPNRPEPVVTAHVQIPSDRASAVARIGARAARRLDDLCVLGVAAADTLIASSALSPGDLQAEPLGLVLGTALGCLESDHGFYLRELNPEAYDPSPRLFAYTLPNIVLGETAIRHRLTGENVVVSAGRASGLVALTEADRRIRSGAWARAMVLIVDAVGPAAELLAPKMTGVAWAWLLEQRSLATARGAEIWGVAQGTVRRAPVGDLRTPARVVPPADGGEPLGAAGLEALSQHLRNRAPGTVEVVCPSGYAARVEWTPQR